jgi:8-oxo-dGTP pyrophosphatase MutT (NUDIX family)
MERHYTVTGYVVHEGRTLLHRHRKLSMWLPPGGHVEPDEDPVQAVLREIEEETGLTVALLPQTPVVGGFSAPRQLTPPVTILVEDIDEPGRPHQHIDMIYFTQPAGDATLTPEHGEWRWVTRDELELALVAGAEESGPIAEDVRKLGLLAIERAAALVAAR